MPPRTCSGRWLNRVRKRTVSRSRNPLKNRENPYLEAPCRPAPMADLDLGDAKPSRVRQDRDETVQLAVDADLAQHLAAVKLEPAIVVVQAAAGQRADHPVEDPAGIDLVPGVVASLLPAADDVVSLFELGQEAGNLGRVVLKVAVEREDEVAPAA